MRDVRVECLHVQRIVSTHTRVSPGDPPAIVRDLRAGDRTPQRVVGDFERAFPGVRLCPSGNRYHQWHQGDEEQGCQWWRHVAARSA